mgnify:CR=1 FL=1
MFSPGGGGGRKQEGTMGEGVEGSESERWGLGVWVGGAGEGGIRELYCMGGCTACGGRA